MNNIFEGAKFGDKFLTRNGEVAIYHYNNGDSHHKLILESGYGYFCHDSGYEDVDGYIRSDCDIVSRYQEPIDEDKLDEFSDNYYFNEELESSGEFERIKNAYKAGYHKAMEE